MKKINPFLIRISRQLGYWYHRSFRLRKNEFKVFAKNNHHWFLGYYDANINYNEKIFFHEVVGRNVKSPKFCKINVVDVNTRNVSEVDQSSAINWQIGSRLQVCETDLVFNDIIDGMQIHRITDIETGVQREMNFPFWIKNKKNNITISIDFERLWGVRRGYGYNGTIRKDLRDSIGIFNYSGNSEINIIPLTRICCELKLEKGGYLNHAIINYDASLILSTYNIQSNNTRRVIPVIYNIVEDKLGSFDPGNTFSHPTFVSSNEVGYFDGVGYCIVNLCTLQKNYLLKTKLDGHPTFKDPRYFITDTYPDKFSKMKIYTCEHGRIQVLTEIINPPAYNGDARCDLHPRLINGNVLFDIPRPSGRAFGMIHIDD